MDNTPQPDGVDEAEVRSELEKIVTSGLFHPSEQAILLLRFIVECTLQEGEAPKEYRLAVEALGRGPEFDPRNDTIVRVQVRKLRAKLAKYYGTDGTADPIVIDIPVGLYTARFHKNQRKNEAPASADEQRAPRPRGAWLIRSLIVACSIAAVGYMLFYLLLPSSSRIEATQFLRMTWNPGLYLAPAISGDGKKLVYSAYGANGNLNLYGQDTRGGDPVLLTSGPMDIQEPTVSPDGRRVIFRSGQQNSGLWELVVGSAEVPRRFSKDGRQPRFSPDGTQVAFWVPEIPNSPLEPLSPLFFGPHSSIHGLQHGLIFYTDPNTSRVRLLPLTLGAAGLPSWSPDGRYLIVYGSSQNNGYRQEDADWWVVSSAPTDTPVKPVRTGIGTQLRRRGVEPLLYPACWVGEQLYFVASFGESVDLWQARISGRTHQVEGDIRKVSLGNGSALGPTASAAGKLAFPIASGDVNVWALPVHADSGVPTGQLERITSGSAPTFWSTASSDGSQVAYCSRRFGLIDLFIKDMRNGTVRRLASAVEVPRLSPDGSRIAFSRPEAGKVAVYEADIGGGSPRRVSADAGEVIGWWPDGRSILFDREASHIHGHRFQLNPAKDSEFSRHPVADSFLQSPSPDQSWVALFCHSKLFVVPIRDSLAASDDQWIQVTDGSDSVSLARWSPDGNLLYFVSNRDGHRCIWVQRLAPGNRRPEGRPTVVCHLHAPGPSMDHLSDEVLSFDVSATKLFMVLGEFSSTIFTLSP